MTLKRRNGHHHTPAGGCKFHFVVTADLPLTSQTQYFQVLYGMCCTAKRSGVPERRLHVYE